MLHSITDVHAHYDEAVFDTDRGEVLRTLREAGVCAIVNSGSSVPSSRRSLDLAKRFEGVYASVGVFPLEAYNVPSGWLEQISDMAEEDGCVAVGEIGLDYHLEDGAGPTYAQRETQKNVFRAQLELARRKGMPVVIHDRDADEDVIRLLAELPCPGMIHRFFSRAEYGFQLLEMGLSLESARLSLIPMRGSWSRWCGRCRWSGCCWKRTLRFYPAPALKANGRLRI